MMRRLTGIALVAVGALLAGLVAAPGPVGASGDAFVVSPSAGVPGDIVEGVVDVALVEEHCVTDVGPVREMFANLGAGPGPVFEAWLDRLPMVGFSDEDIGGFPAAAFQALFLGSTGTLDGVNPATTEQMVAGLVFLAMDAIGTSDELAAEYLEQTFVLTFADPRTEQPVGAPSSFSPTTGEGSIEVPVLDPGLWVVAATCVEPVVTDESFLAAVDAGVQWWQENEDSLPPPFPGWSTTASQEVAPQLAAVVLAALMEPQPGAGPWIDFYCVLNEEGFCATPPDPVGLLEELSDEELAEFADLQADDSTADGDAGPDGLAVEPVSASPAFTG